MDPYTDVNKKIERTIEQANRLLPNKQVPKTATLNKHGNMQAPPKQVVGFIEATKENLHKSLKYNVEFAELYPTLMKMYNLESKTVKVNKDPMIESNTKTLFRRQN